MTTDLPGSVAGREEAIMATRKVKLTKAQKLTAWWNAHRARISAAWPFVVLGLAAMYVSYGHIMYVTAQNVTSAHNLPLVPQIMPIIVDVLLIASGRAVKVARTPLARLTALASFAVALTASLACNMLASDPGFWHRAVATWPAIALLIVAVNTEIAGRKPMSAAAIARRVQERMARKAARKGIRPTPNAPQSPPVGQWAAEQVAPGTYASHGAR